MEAGAMGGLAREDLDRLLRVGRELVSAHDPETVLRRVLEAARELTDSRYAALGVLDHAKRELERFVFVGIDQELRERIGSLPRGHGILGELIRHPEPLRLSRLSEHPRSYGFPAEHPPMETFLGVPVMIRGEVYGNLYLTEKGDGERFDERDEALVVVLAEWAAIAIDNARSHATSERRRDELGRAVRALQATVTLSLELGGEGDLDRILELIVKRGRALAGSRSTLVLLDDGESMRVAACAGEIDQDVLGRAAEPTGTLAVNETRRVDERVIAALVGSGAGESGLLAPLRSRGRRLGLLLAVDRADEDEGDFSADDELALASFATSAATSIAAALAAEDERVRVSIAASEQERQRWARELHDETLQDLGVIRMRHEIALETDDAASAREALGDSLELLDATIDGLRGLITELRPAALDQLGIGPAVEALVDRIRGRANLQIETTIDVGLEGEVPRRYEPELEATVYRLVQEALTNVVKHADAKLVAVTLAERGDALVVTIEDDGRGLDRSRHDDGFGLRGMQERVQLAAGELRLGGGERGGTRVWASLPLAERD